MWNEFKFFTRNVLHDLLLGVPAVVRPVLGCVYIYIYIYIYVYICVYIYIYIYHMLIMYYYAFIYVILDYRNIMDLIVFN